MQNMFDPSELFSGKDFGFKQKPQELLWETEEASNEKEFYFHRQCLFILKRKGETQANRQNLRNMSRQFGVQIHVLNYLFLASI